MVVAIVFFLGFSLKNRCSPDFKLTLNFIITIITASSDFFHPLVNTLDFHKSIIIAIIILITTTTTTTAAAMVSCFNSEELNL